MPAAALHSILPRRWIELCLCLVFAMVVLGGFTRLTESGLSIVHWDLISGILPPLGSAGWQKEFAEYQSSPQYRLVNHGMNLGEFQHIFWLEYFHRLLGRIVGFVFFLPLIGFMMARALPRWLSKRMIIATLLVGMQGAVGWLMVKSGLENMPWVSPSRLALHLLLAFSLLALLAVTRCRLMMEGDAPIADGVPLPPRLLFLSRLAVTLLLTQILLGAFVAGTRAGLIDNTYPLMDGSFMPAGMWRLHPWSENLQWHNIVENRETLQFLHRWWAIVAGSALVFVSLRTYRIVPQTRLRTMAIATIALVILQIALGIATVIHAVPVGLGAIHQAVAALLFGWSTAMVYVMSRTRQSADFRPSQPMPTSLFPGLLPP